MSYPCQCSPCQDCITVSSCPSGDCLKIASLLIKPEDSVLPCSVVGSVDVGAESDTSICDTTINWVLLDYDDTAFENVSINSAGVITFTTKTSAQTHVGYVFTGRATCTGTYLSQYFTVTLFIKDACYGVSCPEGEECSPCTGACITSPDVDLS